MKKVFLFALICGMFIGCSDDKEPNINHYSKAEITGAWEVTNVANMFIIFNENSNFEGSYASGEDYTGTYTISGNNVVCKNLAPKPTGLESDIMPEPIEPAIIGMDYYIADIYNNVYNKPIDLKSAGIAADLIAQLADEELEDATTLLNEIKILLEENETFKGAIIVDKGERKFFVEEKSTVGMFILSTTFDNGTKERKELRVKKTVIVEEPAE